MLIEINILQTHIPDIINFVSEKVLIQKERLNIKEILNINGEYKLNLDIKKIYLLFFDSNSNSNSEIFINQSKYNLISNGLIFADDNCEINISSDIEVKLFVFVDLLKDCNTEQNELIKYKPHNGIFILENCELITNEFCTELINYINDNDNPGIEKWGPNTNVNCKFININEIKNQKIKKSFDSQLFKLIGWVIYQLREKYNITCTGDSGYCLRKIYGPTRLHADGININPINNRYLPIKKIRNMSVIICLNDDYDGGEFYFPSQDYKIKLKKGQIISFPPYWTHPHMVSEPKNNTYRYTINTWLYE